jgi:hypothetical protein
MSENAKYRVSLGDSSQLDEMRNGYLAKAGKAYDKPKDVDEIKYKVPKTKLGQWIEDNHVVSKLAVGVIGLLPISCSRIWRTYRTCGNIWFTTIRSRQEKPKATNGKGATTWIRINRI